MIRDINVRVHTFRKSMVVYIKYDISQFILKVSGVAIDKKIGVTLPRYKDQCINICKVKEVYKKAVGSDHTSYTYIRHFLEVWNFIYVSLHYKKIMSSTHKTSNSLL